MKMKVSLKNFPDIKAVLVPFTVIVTPCTPLTLEAQTKIQPINVEMVKGNEGADFKFVLPKYTQKPFCGLDVNYKIAGQKSWLSFEDKSH